ncbi:MAG: FtsX-like permease family protein [Blastocatellia bacterium]
MLSLGAGLLLRSFVAVLWQTDFGFKPDHVVSLRVVMPHGRYAQPADFIAQVVQRAAALPGVVSAGAVDNLPLSGSHNSSFFQITGQPPFPPASKPTTEVRLATPGYFAAIGTPLRAGRLMNEQDNAQAPPVALVNEAFAARYFPGRSAVGQRLDFGSGTPVEIVGIIANVMNDDLDNLAEPGVYQPHAQWPRESMSLVVRSELAQAQLVGALRQELAALDPNLPLSQVKTLDEIVRERSSPKRVMTALLGVFALIALALATVGLYAVMSYAVTQRTNEIGIRMALGAQTQDVLRLILRQGLQLALLGMTLGLLGALALNRVLAQILYGVTATDPLTVGLVVGLFALVAGLACSVPALRATKVDPMAALRHE